MESHGSQYIGGGAGGGSRENRRGGLTRRLGMAQVIKWMNLACGWIQKRKPPWFDVGSNPELDERGHHSELCHYFWSRNSGFRDECGISCTHLQHFMGAPIYEWKSNHFYFLTFGFSSPPYHKRKGEKGGREVGKKETDTQTQRENLSISFASWNSSFFGGETLWKNISEIRGNV